MEIKKVNDTLNWLFEKYLENPNGTWEVIPATHNGLTTEIAHEHEFGKYLARKGFIKHYHETKNGFTCAITMLGINQVSNEFTDVKYKILEASIEHKKTSIMEILGIEPGHFRRGHDYATHLKRLGIIECIFHTDDIFAEPTFFGKEWYELNKIRVAN
jgi:hypothetical protein